MLNDDVGAGERGQGEEVEGGWRYDGTMKLEMLAMGGKKETKEKSWTMKRVYQAER